MEYAMALSPHEQDPALPWLILPYHSPELGWLSCLTFPRRLPPTDVAYGILASSNWADWFDLTPALVSLGAEADGNGQTETVRYGLPASIEAGHFLFLRLRVKQP